MATSDKTSPPIYKDPAPTPEQDTREARPERFGTRPEELRNDPEQRLGV